MISDIELLKQIWRERFFGVTTGFEELNWQIWQNNKDELI